MAHDPRLDNSRPAGRTGRNGSDEDFAVEPDDGALTPDLLPLDELDEDQIRAYSEFTSPRSGFGSGLVFLYDELEAGYAD